MLAKKILPGVIALLLALIPTYFIIYNSVNATGLPDFTAIDKVLIKEPLSGTDPNRSHKTLRSDRTADRDALFLLTTVLSNLESISAIPDGVKDGSFYELVFTSKNNVETTCYIYDSGRDLSLYLETPSGKAFLLPQPGVAYKNRTVDPFFYTYAVKRPNGTVYVSKDEYRGETPTVFALHAASELSALSFEDTPSTVKVHAKNGEEVLLDYVSMDEACSSTLESGTAVTVNVEWEIDEGLYYRAAYSFIVESASQ